MFSLASGLYTQYFSPQQINVLVVGVKGVGKSTILERIKVTDFPTHSRKNNNHNTSTLHNTAPLTIEAAISTIATGEGLLNGTGEPLHNNNKNNNNHKPTPSSTIAAPELLRTPIFLSHDPHDFDAPARRRQSRRSPHGSSSSDGPTPSSMFAYICPAPPKFGARSTTTMTMTTNLSLIKDTSDHDLHEDMFDQESDDEWFHDENDDNDHDDNRSELSRSSTAADEDESGSLRDTLSMRSEKPFEATRVRIMKRSNSDPRLMDDDHHHLLHHKKNSKQSPLPPVVRRGGAPLGLPAPRRINATSATSTTNSTSNAMVSAGRDGSTGGRMESIDLGRPTTRSQQQQQQQPFRAVEANDNWKGPLPQYDLKPGAKLLPLEKIRPTIGMNLAKMDACGAKVHVFDVSGKFQNLWERYYADADAVLFVWKLSRADAVAWQTATNGNSDDDDDDDSVGMVTVEQQKQALEQVRSAVADDVPFGILGHLFQTNPPYNCEPDVLYSTSQLLPHYHNPHQALFLGNAVTGQGIKTCFEWLIGAAKRQQRIRERQSDLGKH